MKVPLRLSQAPAAGLSRSTLHRQAQAGQYQRIARGIYLPAGVEADWDLVEAAARKPQATICLISALAHHDLSDVIPSQLEVAVPRGEHMPVGNTAISWHSFDRETFDVGRSLMRIEGTALEIGLYSAERTIADAFRLRGAIGYEIGREALKEWLRRGGKPTVLLDVAAHLPRTKGLVLQALEWLA